MYTSLGRLREIERDGDRAWKRKREDTLEGKQQEFQIYNQFARVLVIHIYSTCLYWFTFGEKSTSCWTGANWNGIPPYSRLYFVLISTNTCRLHWQHSIARCIWLHAKSFVFSKISLIDYIDSYLDWLLAIKKNHTVTSQSRETKLNAA